MRRRALAGWLQTGLAAFLWLGSSGCPRQAQVQLHPGERIDDPEELLRAVRARGQEISSLRAEGTMVVRRGGKRLKAHVLLIVRRPALLRFETQSFFEQPLSILVTDGMDFSLWDLDRGRFYLGRATSANVSRVIPVPLDGPEISGVLLGDPPLIAYARSSLEWDQKKGLYRLTLENLREQQEILVHPRMLRPAEIACRVGARLLYRLKYLDWHQGEDQSPVPRELLLEMPAEDVLLQVKLRQAQRNLPLKDELFTLDAPPGVPIERPGEGE